MTALAARLGLGLMLGLMGLLAHGEASSAWAQPARGRVGLGAQVGRPSGLSLKLYRRAPLAYQGAIMWDLEGRVFATAHRVVEHPLSNSPLNYFIGPGLFGEIDTAPRENRVRLGISGSFGLNFFRERFEVFLHVMPRLQLLRTVDVQLGGAVGLRYTL